MMKKTPKKPTVSHMLYNWNIIGHQKQLLALEKEIETEKMTHAYLFHGPKDTGKFTVARLFSKILICPNRLCHQCRDCQLIESGVHPDLIRLSDNGETIKIDDIRSLIQKTSLTSQSGQRVVLIENIERMPAEAQNSFLKTLEEPAGNTIFIMSSSNVRKILPTILSRIRLYEFSTVDSAILKQWLLNRFGSHPDLEEVTELAQGRPGMAIKLLENPPLLSEYRSVFFQIDRFLSQNDLLAKFEYAEALDKDEVAMERFLDAFCLRIRRLMLDFSREKNHPLQNRYQLRDLTELFEKIIETRYLSIRNVNKRLVLENFFLATER